jgi:hypothetical protein
MQYYLIVLKKVTEKHIENVYASYDDCFDALATEADAQSQWFPENYEEIKNNFIIENILAFYHLKNAQQDQRASIRDYQNKILDLDSENQLIVLCKIGRTQQEEYLEQKITALQNKISKEHKGLLKKLKKIVLKKITINNAKPPSTNHTTSPASPPVKINKKSRSISQTILYKPKVTALEEEFQFVFEK